jgi:sugar-specific transcriptional regulator TrmB
VVCGGGRLYCDDEFVVRRKIFMHFQHAVEQLGLSEHEAKVYLAALRLGIANNTDIAAGAKLPRTTCAGVLATLQEKGLVNYFIGKKRGSKRMFSAENPDKFLTMIKEREAVFQSIMPQLKALHRAAGAKPSVYFYEGLDSIRKIFSDILEAQRPLLAITSIDDANKTLGTHFTQFIRTRTSKGMPVRLLTMRTPASLQIKEFDQENLRKTRFFPAGFRLTTANFVYGNRIAIISLNRAKVMGLIIEDEDIAQTFTTYFELMWAGAAS